MIEDYNLFMAGHKIELVEAALLKEGFRAFLVEQERALLFANEHEIDQYRQFKRERACEVLTSRKNVGAFHHAGDGFVSPFLQEIRAKVESGQASYPGMKATELIRQGREDVRALLLEIAARSRHQRASEAAAESDDTSVVKTLGGAAALVASHAKTTGATVSGHKKVSDGLVLYTYSVDEEECIAMTVGGLPRISQAGFDVPWKPYLIKKSTANLTGTHISTLGEAKLIDVGSAIAGFSLYNSGETAREFSHSLRAYDSAVRLILAQAK